MSRLETRGLSKSFGLFQAVSNVSVNFEPAKIHAIVGENGAGKSTLLKMLFGLYKPTKGKILLDGLEKIWANPREAIEHGLGMVQQHFSLVNQISVIDNIILGAEVTNHFGHIHRKHAIHHLEKLLPSSKLAVDWLRPVADLSVGEKQKVEILKLLYRETNILFLDEPTAVLTPLEAEDFFEVLRSLKLSGHTIILITHKINEVFALCDTFTVLRHGEVTAQGIVAESNRDFLVEKMIGRKLNENKLARHLIQDKIVFSANALSQNGESRGRMHQISLNVHASEIVGIAGVEGSGQSALVDSIMGLSSFSGNIQVLDENILPLSTKRIRSLGIGLIPEDRLLQGLWGAESCYNNMIIGLEENFSKYQILDKQKIIAETSSWAKSFDARASSLELPVASLSGGNQQKILFAREVSGRKPRFFICHQPTRGIDLGAIELIQQRLLQLRNEGLGILVLSSELDELFMLCDRIYVFFEGKVAAEFPRANFDRLKIGAAMAGVNLCN